MSDAEYCAELLGRNWEHLVPDNYIQLNKTQIFYLLWTPQQQTLKVGKAKDEENLLLRLQERRRQCGHTIILGIKHLEKPEDEEMVWKDFLSDHAISRETFDLSFCDSDFRWLENFTVKRQIIENAEREKDINVRWYGRVTKGRDLEMLIKAYLSWENCKNKDEDYPSFCDLEPFLS